MNLVFKAHRVTFLLLALLVLAGAIPAGAQMNYGVLVGSVTDPSGAAIPEAKAVVTNQNTGVSASTVTDATGFFQVPYLIPGTYDLTISKEGFKTVKRVGITIQVDQKPRVDITLEVGAVTQSVTVTAEAPLLKTQSSENSQVFNQTTITGLPVEFRSFAQLARLTSGVVPGASWSGMGSQWSTDVTVAISDFMVGGLSTQVNSFLIDGVEANEAYFGVLTVNPSMDAIQEFKVQTSNFNAEFGRVGGAAVQVSIKSGTNKFHGGAFEFLRNQKLDAASYYTAKVGGDPDPLQQNQFGANIGGPIKKDKLFFFGDWEGFRLRQAVAYTTSVPTAKVKAGDFSDYLTSGPIIENPFIDPVEVDGELQRTPVVGNNMATDPAISPYITDVGKNVLAIYPSPNYTASGTGYGINNFYGTSGQPHNIDSFDSRIDYHISDRDQMFARWSMSRATLTYLSILGMRAGGGQPGNQESYTRDQNAVLSWTHSFSPTTFNELRIGVNRTRVDVTNLDSDLQTAAEVGIPGINDYCAICSGLPTLYISGYAQLGAGQFAPTYRHSTFFQYIDNLTMMRGKHTIKFGGEVVRKQATLWQSQYGIGYFSLSGTYTSNLGSGAPGGVAAGSGAADLLLGLPTDLGRDTLSTSPSGRNTQYAAYLQDDFRLTKNLTLNLGVRVEYYSPLVDVNNNLSNFDRTSGDILMACIATTCSGVNPAPAIWGPRLGLAYRINDKTVLRMNFANSTYAQSQNGALNDNYPMIIKQRTYATNNYYPLDSNPKLADGMPLPPTPTVRPGAVSRGRLIPVGDVYWFDENVKMPRINQWLIGIQRQLTPNMMLDISGTGNAVDNLSISPQQLNTPAYGAVRAAGGDYNAARPYHAVDPDLGSVSQYSVPGGFSQYASLQAKLEKRVSHGLTASVAYTWSKAMQRTNSCARDPFDWMANKCLITYDVPHRIVVNYVYSVPVGRGLKFGNNWGRGMDMALGGWQVSGITSYQSGVPFTPGYASTYVMDNSIGAGADRICNGRLDNRTLEKWFNPDCWTSGPAPASADVNPAFGNAGTNVLRGPNFKQWDIAAMKNFKWTEERYLQFRAEFFNTWNQVSWGTPGTTAGTASAGLVQSVNGSYIPRQIQFGLKLFF